MFYFDHQSVLIEIKVINNNGVISYLIGNEEYSNVPQSILDLAFVPANWNRALKFFTIETDKEVVATGYYMISFDIYLDFIKQSTIFLTKNYFFQKIVEQEFFAKNFMPNIFKFKNRNKNVSSNKEGINQEFIETYNIQNAKTPAKDMSIHRHLVHEGFDLNKFKFKDVFVISNRFELVQTNKNQRIYYLPKELLLEDYSILDKIDYVDLDRGVFTLNTTLEWSYNIVAEFYFENSLLANQLITNVEKLLSENIDKDTVYWHLFNITNNYQYLVKGIEVAFEGIDFETAIKNIEKIFRELKLNYLTYILDNKATFNTLSKYAVNNDEIDLLNTILKRYKKI
ncbi:hypothetical protein [[Acholeplasma] multilocale]|uniref:hypothetical protein n=1 Tax=[Acholeplasma] multilocale TaxID=264638 RepID=UPI00047C6E79|nr:hypothetical protein [[Acholeplasma] multilocale]